jgi:hypothetical protein
MEKLFYLSQVCDGLNVVGTVFLVISSIAVIVLLIVKYCVTADMDKYNKEESERTIEIVSRWIHRSWWILAISIIVTVFVPDRKTFLFMMGGKAVDELVENTNVKELPSNTVDLLNEYIKAETEKIKQNN